MYALNQASTDPLILTGNEFGQSLYGNLGDNYLNGGQGADFLVGLAGNDNLLGGTGRRPYGRAAPATTSIMSMRRATWLTELAGEGDDIVVATASYTLTAGASIETMVARAEQRRQHQPHRQRAWPRASTAMPATIS